MRKILKVLVPVILLIAIEVCGCGSKNKLNGSWTSEDSNITMVFEQDGTGLYKLGSEDSWLRLAYDMTYSLDGDSLEIITDLDGVKIVDNYKISFENGNLVMTDKKGETQTYYKK